MGALTDLLARLGDAEQAVGRVEQRFRGVGTEISDAADDADRLAKASAAVGAGGGATGTATPFRPAPGAPGGGLPLFPLFPIPGVPPPPPGTVFGSRGEVRRSPSPTRGRAADTSLPSTGIPELDALIADAVADIGASPAAIEALTALIEGLQPPQLVESPGALSTDFITSGTRDRLAGRRVRGPTGFSADPFADNRVRTFAGLLGTEPRRRGIQFQGAFGGLGQTTTGTVANDPMITFGAILRQIIALLLSFQRPGAPDELRDRPRPLPRPGPDPVPDPQPVPGDGGGGQEPAPGPGREQEAADRRRADEQATRQRSREIELLERIAASSAATVQLLTRSGGGGGLTVQEFRAGGGLLP